jgi:hypothetical protein
MSLNLFLPFISTLIMFAFTALVFQRYFSRRSGSLHLLFWGIGLLMFGLGSFAEAYSPFGWNPIIFMIWYAFGAALNAGWLGQGSVYLLARGKARKVAHGITVMLALLSLFSLYLMWTTPLDASRFDPTIALSEQYRDIMPPGALVRRLTPIFNIYGLITLVGGALYSAYLFWRKRVMGNRVIGNILIAAGALSIGFASTLTRLGFGAYLYLGELVAAILMFAGFIIASRRVSDSLEIETAPAQSSTSPA